MGGAVDHLETLKDFLRPFGEEGICIAFSGGVDSSVLLKAATLVAPDRVTAVTLKTPFHTAPELSEATAFAESCGVTHTVLTLDELPPEVMANPPERCYLCKRSIFTYIWDYARENNLWHVLDGTNADDLGQYRPGLKALAELGVMSPFASLGLPKSAVREIGELLGLSIAHKPSAPCLATRFPYNTPIDLALLPKVEQIETAVKAVGSEVVRARVHGDTIRLEVPGEDFVTVAAASASLVETARALGFARLTLDLAGYRSGSFDTSFAVAPTGTSHT